jgi:hypothetical protein
LLAGCARRAGGKLFVRHGRDFDVNIDAVQQRAAILNRL